MNTTAAALSLIALGVTLLGMIVPFLFGARGRDANWLASLSVGVTIWLAAQSYAFLTGSWEVPAAILNALANLLPALLIGFLQPRRGWILILVASLLVIPIAVARYYEAVDSRAGILLLLWQIAMWSWSVYLIAARVKEERVNHDQSRRKLMRLIMIALSAFVPIIIIIASFSGRLVTYGFLFPLLMIALQLILLTGMARLRFYDIEVRAARATELAAESVDAERMALLGELTATLAHEIRNPLTGIRSLAQRLANDEVDAEKRRRYAEVILDESGRVEQLVGSLLNVARRSAQTPSHSSTNVHDVADSVKILVDPRARKRKITVTNRVSIALILDTNREALTQSLLNLVINAVHHSPEGGEVVIDATISDSVLITVRDHGSGIEEAENQEIWKPFYSRTGGTGIGLAVVDRLSRELGWTATCANAEDGGARFTLSIPRSEGAGEAE